MADQAVSIGLTLENMALSLAESGAVSRHELVRVLERTAERIRMSDLGPTTFLEPDDLVTQAEAARVIGVSRQAVNQWIAKGLVSSHEAVDPKGRQTTLVSLSEVAVVGNRRPEGGLSASLKRQFENFLNLLVDKLPANLIDGLVDALTPSNTPARESLSSDLLRAFLVSAMESDAGDGGFTHDTAGMLADLPPLLTIEPSHGYFHLADSMNLLVSSSDNTKGFDSPGTAVLSLLALATVGASMNHTHARIGLQIAGAAESVWANAWIDRLFDLAFQLDELSTPTLVRYTASMSHLTPNRFFRQAQSSGVSISYGRSPGLLLPQSYYGDPLLRDILARRPRPNPWTLSPEALANVQTAAKLPEQNPFRMFTFEKGLLDTTIHGVRRYVFSGEDARQRFRAYSDQLSRTEQIRYRELAELSLAHAMQTSLVDIVSIDKIDNFDWWKDHVIRASDREVVIGLRDARARVVAHAVRVRTSILPEVVAATPMEGMLRERVRIYVKNLDYSMIEERYLDDLRVGSGRLIHATTQKMSRLELEQAAEAEIARMASTRPSKKRQRETPLEI